MGLAFLIILKVFHDISASYIFLRKCFECKTISFVRPGYALDFGHKLDQSSGSDGAENIYTT